MEASVSKHLTPCGGTRLRPCARWKLCPPCNNITASRASASIHQTIEMLEIDPQDVYALTVTLPGYWHGIRKGSIWQQHAYITGRQTLWKYWKKTGSWPMRGLNVRLTEHGVLGGWHFIECTFNSTTHCWNMHFHSILLGDRPDWLPLSELEVNDDPILGFTKSVKDWEEQSPEVRQGGLQLRKLGFGEVYSLERSQDTGEVVSYCVKLAYASKQALKGPAKRLQAFLRSVKPRLVRPFGIARMSMDDRINWHLEQDNHDIADMLMSKQNRQE